MKENWKWWTLLKFFAWPLQSVQNEKHQKMINVQGLPHLISSINSISPSQNNSYFPSTFCVAIFEVADSLHFHSFYFTVYGPIFSFTTFTAISFLKLLECNCFIFPLLWKSKFKSKKSFFFIANIFYSSKIRKKNQIQNSFTNYQKTFSDFFNEKSDVQIKNIFYFSKKTN